MTKGEYCWKVGIHFCNPTFDITEEADEKFKADIDKFVAEFANIVKTKVRKKYETN